MRKGPRQRDNEVRGQEYFTPRRERVVPESIKATIAMFTGEDPSIILHVKQDD